MRALGRAAGVDDAAGNPARVTFFAQEIPVDRFLTVVSFLLVDPKGRLVDQGPMPNGVPLHVAQGDRLQARFMVAAA